MKPNKSKTLLGQVATWVRDSVAIASMVMAGFNNHIQPSRNLRRSYTRCFRLHLDKGKRIIREALARNEEEDGVLGPAVATLTSAKTRFDQWDLDDEIAPGFCPKNRRAVREFVLATRNAANSYIDASDVSNNTEAELDEFVRHAVSSAKALKKILKSVEK